MTYKAAEFLAKEEHGMNYVNGMGGYWTKPTSDPKTAYELMQVAADLRLQHAYDRNKTGFSSDYGHLNSWYAAQQAADNIRPNINFVQNTNHNTYYDEIQIRPKYNPFDGK
jgi:aromatic ring hydroxylase